MDGQIAIQESSVKSENGAELKSLGQPGAHPPCPSLDIRWVVSQLTGGTNTIAVLCFLIHGVWVRQLDSFVSVVCLIIS